MITCSWNNAFYFPTGISVSISTFSLVAIAIERYSAICNPLKSRVWQTRSHAYRVIAATWVLAFLIMIPYPIISHLDSFQRPDNTTAHQCRHKWPLAKAEQTWWVKVWNGGNVALWARSECQCSSWIVKKKTLTLTRYTCSVAFHSHIHTLTAMPSGALWESYSGTLQRSGGQTTNSPVSGWRSTSRARAEPKRAVWQEHKCRRAIKSVIIIVNVSSKHWSIRFANIF